MRAPEEVVDFDAIYDHPAPWDIARAQPAFVSLADEGAIRGAVLDLGCGTGDNAIMLAARGLDVVGVDFSPKAIAEAQRRASGVATVRFEVGDALDLPGFVRSFDTVIDSGVLHVFTDASRMRYVDTLGRVLRPGGRYFVLAFREPTGDGGPRAITREVIDRTFTAGWRVARVVDTDFEVRLGPGSFPAVLAEIERL